jgi:16S rRNA (guanine1516-N2)-methyltransferase
MTHRIATSYLNAEQQPQAERLAERLGVACIPLDQQNGYDYLLLYTPHYLGLLNPKEPRTTPLFIDFLSGKMRYRRQHASLRNEYLAKAMGKKPHQHPRILDATAGLGRDSFILASLGYQLTSVERSPILHALLEDAIARGKKDASTCDIMSRINLILHDSASYILENDDYDIIYLDPMFPERQKSASAKKELVILQNLLEIDENAHELLSISLKKAKWRVVVKRPRLALPLANHKPSFSLTGSSSRFDIYL